MYITFNYMHSRYQHVLMINGKSRGGTLILSIWIQEVSEVGVGPSQ